MSSQPFRSIYTLDGQGYDFSESYQSKYHSKNLEPPSSTFKRCNYELDGQGFTYENKYAKQPESAESVSSDSRTNSTVGDDGLFRGVYDLGQRPSLSRDQSRSSVSSRPSFFKRVSSST